MHVSYTPCLWDVLLTGYVSCIFAGRKQDVDNTHDQEGIHELVFPSASQDVSADYNVFHHHHDRCHHFHCRWLNFIMPLLGTVAQLRQKHQ